MKLADQNAEKDGSVERVALELLKYVAAGERKELGTSGTPIERHYILDTYAECLATIRNPTGRLIAAKREQRT